MSIALISDPTPIRTSENIALREPVLERVAAGDENAVNECVQTYGSLVWSLAKRMTNNLTDAEDAVQEIFIELWQKAGRFDPQRSSESSFIAMVARRRLIDRIRRTGRSPELVGDSTQLLQVAETIRFDSAEATDEAAKAKQCLSKLSEKQQEVVALTISSGVSQSNAAKHLNLPLGTVKSYARRALIQLRDCMKLTATPQAGGTQ